jgi:Putative MetA-pathway of phenol degradation
MFRSMGVLAVAAIALMATTVAAQAQDKSQYTLFNPTPDSEMRSFSTDRPTKSNVPYTVDAGHFQYEGDLVIYGYNNTSTPDTTTTTWTVGNPTFKAGLTNNADFEVNFSAYNDIQTLTRSTWATTKVTGFGDTYTRLKVNLFGNDGGKAAFAVIPYAKWPTAPIGVGNGFIEGGLIAPLAISLPYGFTTILMGEVDYLKNPTDNGYHANFPALINVSHALSSSVTAYGEIYADWSTNSNVSNIYTADFAIAWNPRPNFQLDVGINIGLVPAAVPYQLYAGIAQRF